MAPSQTQDVDFRPSDLIGPSGVGSQGELLVNTLLDHYPPALQAAQLKRVNERLDSELDEKALRNVAKIAGVQGVEQARVRGGERSDEDAVVTYAYFDEDGRVVKGCFPYNDLASGKSDDHVSQRDSLNQSTAAAAFRDAHPAAAQSDDGPSAQSDPFALLDAPVDELVDLMREHPDRVEQIKALEQTRKNPRKGVLDYEPAEGDGSGDGQTS